ncbi:MAG: hypothetical protein JRI53_10900 [Deltaproteobacteria bacterium]|nr:hypothetical protein [Deltaproteobacteria bacterium]
MNRRILYGVHPAVFEASFVFIVLSFFPSINGLFPLSSASARSYGETSCVNPPEADKSAELLV